MTNQSIKTESSKRTNERERWRGKPIEMRLKALSKMYLVHDDIKHLLDHIERQILFTSSRNKSNATLVICPSGGGKSSFIDYLEVLYPTVHKEEVTERPVVHFSIPAPLTVKQMDEAFLKALGDPLFNTGSHSEKMERIATLLVKCNVKIIAIDNFHDIPARRGVLGIRAVGDWVRDVCEMKFKGIILALGTEEALIVRDSNDQLKRRMMARIDLPLFSVSDGHGCEAFKKLLVAIDAALPLAESSALDNAMTMAKIFYATAGNMDYLVKFLAMAIVLSVKRGAERLENCDLEQAFIDVHQVAAHHGNPFSSNWDGQALNGTGQVFAKNDDAKSPGKSEKGKDV